MVLLYLLLAGGYCLINIAKLGLFLSYKYYIYFSIEVIYLFVLEFIAPTECYFLGLGTCKAEYVEHDYAMVSGILGIE